MLKSDAMSTTVTTCDRPTFAISTNWPWLEAEFLLSAF
jgi:hypothetical protein